MKKGFIIFLVFLFSFAPALALTNSCDLSLQLLNQDPYPAIPGDYVKIVFQIDGLEDSNCNDVTLNFLEKYPISFDNGSSGIASFKSGTFSRDFPGHAVVPFKVRVDGDAIDGNNPIEVLLSQSGTAELSYTFNLSVEDTKAEFEIYVKNFDFTTNEITLEILNIAEVDVKSITLEILDTEGLSIKGSRTKIIGDLDSNEYTTADFEISPAKAQIPINVYYTDEAGFRRTTQESVSFNSEYFSGRKADEQTTSIWTYVFWIVIIFGLAYWIYKRRKNKKK